MGAAPALAVVLAAVLAYFLGPAEMPGRDVVVLIRPGLAAPAIGRELEDKGLLRSAGVFTLLARVEAGQGAPRAGEFLLNTGWTPMRILRVLATTRGIAHRVVVREGLPWWETAKLFAEENISNQTDFEQAAHNATLLKKYGVPAPSAEGFLFPDTYQMTRGPEGGVAAVETMLHEFDRVSKKLWPQGPPPPAELLRIVTLASLVERETGAPGERPRIAGVFANRLRLGMRLQCDPTTIYGMGPRFNGKITRADLENADNPYNTYARAGLPPGPICSPGLASLKAAINPEQNDFLYFVAKGDGTHEFSRNLDEHNRAVAFYQLHRGANYRSTLGGPAAPDLPAASAAAKPAPEQPKAPAKQQDKQAKNAAKAPAKTSGKTAKAVKDKKSKKTEPAKKSSHKAATHKTRHKS